MPMRTLLMFRLGVFAIAMAALIGCDGSKVILPDLDLPPAPPAAKLIEQQNRNVAPLDQLYTRAVVKITWYDRDGKRRFEEADGPLIYRRPGDLALALGKLGETWYWLGCDEERYWILDLNSDPRQAHVGTHAAAGNDAQASPLPIRADELVEVMGFGKLSNPPGLRVETTRKGYVLSYPADARSGVRREVTLDGQSRIVRVRLLDRRGEVIADAQKVTPFRMEIREIPFDDQPWLMRTTKIEIPAQRTTVEVFMPRTTRGEGKVRDVQFDFDKLIKIQKISPNHIENLDR